MRDVTRTIQSKIQAPSMNCNSIVQSRLRNNLRWQIKHKLARPSREANIEQSI
jgi:hypothetical protein